MEDVSVRFLKFISNTIGRGKSTREILFFASGIMEGIALCKAYPEYAIALEEQIDMDGKANTTEQRNEFLRQLVEQVPISSVN